MSRPFVRTVTGDVSPSSLGRTDYHEHLFQASPLLAGDELTELEPAVSEAADVRAAGIRTLVDLTPIGLGRNPVGLRQVSERTGIFIVMATGLHHDATRCLSVQEIAQRSKHAIKGSRLHAAPGR